MAEIKWIKIATDMFDNKKIKKIRRMPEGNNIVLIWVYLITKAGESNSNGGIFFTETIPYTIQDISEDADFSLDVVRLAIKVLETFGMIEIFEDVLYIKNWEEYQNVEGMDKIREQGKLRAQRFRDSKKTPLLEDSNAKHNVTSRECNATELELDLDIELDKEEHKTIVTDKSVTTSTFKNETEIFNYWNDNKVGIVHNELTTKMRGLITTKLKQYKKDDIIIAIERLKKACDDTNYFYTTRWNLGNFMKQGNGISNWMDEGQLWNAYLDKDKQPMKQGYQPKRESSGSEKFIDVKG